MAEEVQTLSTVADFAKAKGENKKMVIDFTATWCPPCKRMKPIFKDLKAKFADIAFYQVDVDENNETAESEGITAMPTFKTYFNNDIDQTMTGADEGKLKKLISDLDSKQ